MHSIMFRCLWLHQKISTGLGLVLKKLKPQNRSQFDFPKFLKNKQERGKTLGVISFSFIYDHDREDSKKINK